MKRISINQRLKHLGRWRNTHLNQPLQHLHHHPHSRPHCLIILNAPNCHQSNPPSLLSIIHITKSLIHHFPHISLYYLLRRPRWEEPLPSTFCSTLSTSAARRHRLHIPPTADQLQHRHSIAVNICLGCNCHTRNPLRCNIPPRSPHSRQHPTEVPPNELCQPKIRNLGNEITIQKNVLWLDITMYDATPTFFMQISNPLSSANSHPEPNIPTQTRPFLPQINTKSTILHILINQKPVRILRAKPSEPHKIHVLNIPNCGDLSPELLLPTPWPLQPLHSHN